MINQKPALKCYKINVTILDNSIESIARGYVQDENIYADNEHEARKKALSILHSDYSIDEDLFDNPLTYVSVKVYRYHQLDKYNFEENGLPCIRTKQQIEHYDAVNTYKANLDAMLINNPNASAYIKKGGYYYRSNNAGYTEYRTEAGIYPIKEAVQACKSCDINDCMSVIIINIDEHNKLINNKTSELKNRIIKPCLKTRLLSSFKHLFQKLKRK